jgi:lipopolysaccharide transport system ATP-binding protein
VSARDVAVRASRLGKRYRLGRSDFGDSFRTLRDVVVGWTTPRGRAPAEDQTLWALRDVSFEVAAGEVLGIIGHNGAGKSTLLKVLSRITEPTEGRVEIRGRVGSLLDVGTGFHMELTGRENVYLNGAILGMKRAEIARKFDEIVAFSGVERFLDTPVKRYSTGMYLRLGFAVAAHLDTDTLIVDEVLAVGDAAFQQKCLGKMGDVARDGRTVLFVSHNLGALRALCTRALVLRSGRIEFDGATGDGIAYYLSHALPAGEAGGQTQFGPEGLAFGALTIHAVRVVTEAGEPRALFDASDVIRVEVDYAVVTPLRGLRAVLLVSTQEGEAAFQSTDHLTRDANLSPGRYRTTCEIPGSLLNCRMYSVELSFEIPWVQVVAPRRQYVSFTISGGGNHGSSSPEAWPGVVCPSLEWRTELTSDASVTRPDAGPRSA